MLAKDREIRRQQEWWHAAEDTLRFIASVIREEGEPKRTERALCQLLAVIRVGEREEVLVSRGELAELLERTALLHDLLDDWVESGGRFTYLYGLVSAINDRRAGCLTRWTSSRPRFDEWARYLRHRMVEHLAGASDDAEMSHEQADDLSWTAAMALEAAFMVSARWGDDRAIQEMLDDATNCLVDALDHGHADTVEWLRARRTGASTYPSLTPPTNSRRTRSGGCSPSTRTSPAPSSKPVGLVVRAPTTVPRMSRRGRSVMGARALSAPLGLERHQSRRDDLLALVREQPGVTLTQAATRFGLKDSTSLYSVAQRLQQEGLVRKAGPELHPAGKTQKR